MLFFGLTCLCCIAFAAGPASAQVAKKSAVISLKDGLKEMLQKEGAVKLKKLTVNVDAEKAQALFEDHRVDTEGSYVIYQGLDGEGAVINLVVIVNEEGKEGPLQMLIAMRPDGKVYDVGFTVFGEDKGRRAFSWSYLKQFINKNPREDFVLGKDIDGVSGATWTSESIYFAVKRAVVVYDSFFLSN